MQTVPGLVLCEKSEGTLIVFQQDAAGAQDIAHGGVIQIQLQQGADALQPVHQRIAVDEKLPGRGMEVLLLQQVDAQGVQQGGAVGLVVLLQAAQHGVDEGPEVGALGDGADKHVLIQGRGAAAARTAVQVPGGGGGFLIEAPHGAQLQQRGKRHAQDHGLVHAQAHLLQFLQQLFRLHGQGGGVGLCNTKYVQSLVDEGKLPHMTDVVEHQNIWVQRCGSRVNEALVSMWFNNSPEAGNWLIDKCAEFGVVPVSFRAHAPNAIIPESYDYHMFVNVGDHQFDSKCGYFAATNVLYEDSQNAEKYEHPATYFFNTKAQELLVEDGRVTGVFAQRDGELWLFRATKGVILATGGIHEDTEMTDYYCDENIKRVQRCEHGPAGFSTGDGHKMGLWVGAHMQDGPFPLMLHPQACSMFHGCFPFVNQEGHRFMNEGTWVQGKSMNIMHQTGNVAWSIFDADYGKYNRMSLENGTGDMEVTVTITDGKISDIVVNSHAESSDIGAPALDKLIQNAIAANSAEIDGASGATMTSDGFREAVAQALAKAQ